MPAYSKPRHLRPVSVLQQHFNTYRVTGYDKTGGKLFELNIEALTPAEARVLAGAALRAHAVHNLQWQSANESGRIDVTLTKL